MNEKYTQDLVQAIKNKIKEDMNNVYTQFVEDYLKMLETNMEAKRNYIINNIIDGIKISIDNNSHYEAPILII